MSNGPTFLTKAGYEKLQLELDSLRNEKRMEVAERLHKAVAEAGTDNLAEDAEYEAAKNEQAFVEGRIRHLEALLNNVHIIESEDRPGRTAVEIGAKVTIQEEGSDPEEYMIVGAEEADPRHGMISNESPLGRSIMGKKVGDKANVNAPSGSFSIKIVKIE